MPSVCIASLSECISCCGQCRCMVDYVLLCFCRETSVLVYVVGTGIHVGLPSHDSTPTIEYAGTPPPCLHPSLLNVAMAICLNHTSSPENDCLDVSSVFDGQASEQKTCLHPSRR